MCKTQSSSTWLPLCTPHIPHLALCPGQAIKVGSADYISEPMQEKCPSGDKVLQGAEEKATICSFKMHAQVPRADGPGAGVSSV